MVAIVGVDAVRAARVTVVAPDVVGSQMAGPGLRTVAIARELARELDVTLAIGVTGSDPTELEIEGVVCSFYSDRDGLQALVDRSEIVFCQFIDTNVVDIAIRSGRQVVYDLYNVLPIETIGSERISGFTTQPEMDREFAELLRYFRFCMQTGTYFVASNERQRDFWLGYAMASGALAPSSLHERGIDDIIGLAPFGMENADPVQVRRGIRGTHGITDHDVVILWAGGVWDWFDAGTPIHAVARIAARDPRVKLVFYGTVHPNPAIGRPRNVERAMALADELGVLGSNVIFLDSWVAAERRADYLLDADIAVSAHQESLETRYSFRTRILDHFWARLPSVVTDGDWFADYIDDNDLGIVVPSGDVDAMVGAMEGLIRDEGQMIRLRDNIERIRDEWRWSSTIEPLRRTLVDRIAELPPPASSRADFGSDAPVAAAPTDPTVSNARSRAREAVSRSRAGAAYRRVKRALRRYSTEE
ncbi:glycosyltransferase family 4 protein [Agromyces humi]|uniref:glycosyltransferase family 4 protein n=1 Tax=Agromyces humi TaxID=1766800 RepID=UPI001358B7B8|nr:glycosyltransferase family 4 protein [Agromyces humi]